MQDRELANLKRVGIIAAVVGTVVFIALLAVVGYRFIPAFFWGLLVAIIVAIIMMFVFRRNAGSLPQSDAAESHVSPQPLPQSVAPAPKPHDDLGAEGETISGRTPPHLGVEEPVKLNQPEPEPEPEPEANPVKHAETVQTSTSVLTKPVPDTAPDDQPATPARPAALSAARTEGADDLKKIKGIGPKLEQMCNEMGFYHFDQIASWNAAEVAWVDENLKGFKGRVTRDAWIEQAKILAAGGETEFSRRS